MSKILFIEPLTTEKFSPYGDIIEATGEPTVMINQNNCARYHDIAALDFSNGRAGISVFSAKPYAFPLNLEMMERHPLGSQAFIPMSSQPFLVVVAPDRNGIPDRPNAFITKTGQGVNYHRNVWHAVLTPIKEPGMFTVIDRIGDGNNLEEHWFDSPYTIAAVY